jgi:hypothetical protein
MEMQEVSQSWKNIHKQTLLNESFIEVTLDLADPDALAEVESSDNGSAYISDTPEIVSEVDTPTIPYGTLEQNMWVLDYNRKVIPNVNYQDGGYIGDVLSNAEGIFDTKIPTITLEFSEVHTRVIPGLTITWGTAYGEYATHFIVTAYNGNSVVVQKEVNDNKSVTTIIELDIVNYDRITIQVIGWCLPNHRARVDEIFAGWRQVYSKTHLMSFHHEQAVDPISTSLPKMEIGFSLDNSDNSFNPYNPDGFAKYLMERQVVMVRYGMKLSDGTVEWIKGGSFYLSEWYAKQNGITAEFVARDILEFMSALYTDNVSVIQERSLYDLAEEVLQAANLPLNSDGTVKWVIDDSLKEITTTAVIPTDTIANCLQMIANAGCCVLYPDRDGILHIKPIGNEPTDYVINSFNSYVKSEITLSKMIKQIDVAVFEYTIGDKGVETVITKVTSVVGESGETITIDNPLITDNDQASRVGQWVGNYLKNRMTLKSVVRADVSLDALDIVSNENDFNTNNMRMTNVKFEFTGAFRGTGEGRVI